MRQITREATRAFENGYRFKQGNTEVKIYPDGYRELRLHGNVIAYKNDRGIWVQTCGWESNTTKERLNGLNSVNIHQKDFQWFLNGEAWNGLPILVAG